MKDLFETSSEDDEPNEAPNEASAADEVYETSLTDEAVNDTSVTQGILNETFAADQEDEVKDNIDGTRKDSRTQEDNGSGLLCGLIDQAKYISKSLDTTLATLIKLKVDYTIS